MENFICDESKPEKVLRKEYKSWLEQWQKENPGKIVPPGTIYKTTEPEIVGSFPIKNDIKVLPYKENKKIGWSCQEYSGAEITKPGSSELLTKESDLQVGGKIVVPTLFGNCNGIVERDEYGELYAKIGDHSIADLRFAEDDRGCWVTTRVFNVRGLKIFNK